MSLKVTNPQTKSTISAASLTSVVLFFQPVASGFAVSSCIVFVPALLLFCCSHKQRSQHTLNWQLCLLTQSY